MSNNHGLRTILDIAEDGRRVVAHDVTDGKFKARTKMLAQSTGATEALLYGTILGLVTQAGAADEGMAKPWDPAATDGSEVAIGVFKGMPVPAEVRQIENTKIAYYVSGAFYIADLLEESGGVIQAYSGGATGMSQSVDNEIITFN